MTRSVPEWIGSSDDAAVPPRVRLRIFDKFGGICQCGCGRKIRAGEPWDCEDEIAIINGGERRESNLRPFLREHHPAKTKRDVAIKSKTYRVRAKHLGLRRSGRPMPGSRNSPYKITFNHGVVRR